MLATAVASGSVSILAEPQKATAPPLAGAIGLTTGTLTRHLATERQPGKLRLLDLPQLMRDRLGMRVIDLMSACFPSFEPAYLEELRAAAEQAGCILTNLKLNQPQFDLAATDPNQRRRSIEGYFRSIDAAATLGCRWVRPLPRNQRADIDLLRDGYRRLIDYGASRGVTLLIENFGWIASDPDAIPNVIAEVGAGLAASPDTGNWTDAVRHQGLQRAFPHAVTCDFKFFTLGPDGEHDKYDLRQCFQIGWDAGFRGPWCFEHPHADLDRLLDDVVVMRDRLRGWIKASQADSAT